MLAWLWACGSADTATPAGDGDGTGGRASTSDTGGAGADARDPSGTPSGSGGAPGSGSQPGAGGTASGGDSGSGGSSGDSDVDSEGCPITQRGFSTVSGMEQDGTFGGEGGTVVTVTSQAELEMYAGASEAYVIRVQGKIVVSPKGKEINVESNKTIIGVGATGEISEGGFFIGSGKHNIIIRNLTIGDTFLEGDWDGKEQDWDGVQMDTAHHVWLDHIDFHHGGDGLIDSRKDTTFLTVSWSILRDHNKAFGIGWTDNVTAQMTLHHNIHRDTGTRNPSTDNVLRAHLYNNWLLRTGSYGNYSRGGTNMVIENSVFESVKDPHYYDTGSLVAIGNIYEGTSGQMESSGSTYSFFDPSDHYEYDLDPAGELKTLLTQCAGPRPTLGL